MLRAVLIHNMVVLVQCIILILNWIYKIVWWRDRVLEIGYLNWAQFFLIFILKLICYWILKKIDLKRLIFWIDFFLFYCSNITLNLQVIETWVINKSGRKRINKRWRRWNELRLTKLESNPYLLMQIVQKFHAIYVSKK